MDKILFIIFWSFSLSLTVLLVGGAIAPKGETFLQASQNFGRANVWLIFISSLAISTFGVLLWQKRRSDSPQPQEDPPQTSSKETLPKEKARFDVALGSILVLGCLLYILNPMGKPASKNTDKLPQSQNEKLLHQKQLYQKQLEQVLEIEILKRPDGKQLTLAYGVAKICEAAKVPFNEKYIPGSHSHIGSILSYNAKAVELLASLVHSKGLEYKISSKGLHLEKAKESLDQYTTYIEIPLVGMFGKEILFEKVKENFEFAEDNGVKHIVFTINSWGGYVKTAQDILDLMKQKDHKFKYHLIVKRAISASIWVVFASDSIHIVDGATIGGAVVYKHSSNNVEVNAKLNSIIAAELTAMAEAKGHPQLLVRPMVLQKSTLFAWHDKKNRLKMSRRLPKKVPEKKIIVRDTRETLLTLTARQATKVDLGKRFTGKSAKDLGKALGIANWRKYGTPYKGKARPKKSKSKLPSLQDWAFISSILIVNLILNVLFVAWASFLLKIGDNWTTAVKATSLSVVFGIGFGIGIGILLGFVRWYIERNEISLNFLKPQEMALIFSGISGMIAMLSWFLGIKIAYQAKFSNSFYMFLISFIPSNIITSFFVYVLSYMNYWDFKKFIQ